MTPATGRRCITSSPAIKSTPPPTAGGAGQIDNGLINWGNIDSFAGQQASEFTVNRYSSATIDTNWTGWLSTELALGYDDYYDDRVNNTLTFYAPNNTSNPLTGQWAVGETGSTP